jgi:hypothetical protein
MKAVAIQKDIVKPYKNRLVQGNDTGILRKGVSECILFCKKVAPNMFDIKGGYATVPDAENCFHDGVCMISDFTKVVFVFDQPHKKNGYAVKTTNF